MNGYSIAASYCKRAAGYGQGVASLIKEKGSCKTSVFNCLPYQGSVLEAFRRTKHGPVAKLIEFCNRLKRKRGYFLLNAVDF
jgi:hypothetical protein